MLCCWGISWQSLTYRTSSTLNDDKASISTYTRFGFVEFVLDLRGYRNYYCTLLLDKETKCVRQQRHSITNKNY